ncbi:MAG: phage virion morphogenesis protein [Mediterranea sp.]|jgi:phage gpG-like protein|nr:phage virion morphogenesis protein [Mediterranea sp.]
MSQNSDNLRRELEKRLKAFIQHTLSDIRVELGDEFDRNFEREAFFSEKWARRKYNDDESRGLLVGTGALRQSIRNEVSRTDNSVVFTSSVPYASIHNEGGTITVTRKMKGYFWLRYWSIVGKSKSDGGTMFAGKYQRNKKGEKRANRQNRELTAEAEFCRAMALKKVGSKIVIPKRQFIGLHPEVERLIQEIVNKNINDIQQ